MYMMSRHQKAGQNHSLLLGTKFLKMWQSSGIRGKQKQIKIEFIKTLRTH
jgi:hypothetical protein